MTPILLLLSIIKRDTIAYPRAGVYDDEYLERFNEETKDFGLEGSSLNEQRRIVEKIEELFTKLDAGVQSLKQTQALLKSYRRSVLKAAVEGENSAASGARPT